LLPFFKIYFDKRRSIKTIKQNEINYRNFIAFIVLTSCSSTDVNVSETSSQGNGIDKNERQNQFFETSGAANCGAILFT
jgi:hypothetical protein